MIINVSKYGDATDAATAVIAALKDCKPGDTLYFPKNEYHFCKEHCKSRYYHMTNTDSFEFPRKYFAILIEKKNDITIDGGGSVFVLHGNMCAFAAVQCERLELKNFTVRYAVPANVELTVAEKSGNLITYSIGRDNRFNVKNNEVIFYERSPLTEDYYWRMPNNEKSCNAVCHRGRTLFRMPTQPFTGPYKVKRLDAKTIRVICAFPKEYQVGDVIALSMRKGRESCGLFFWESSNIVSKNITINYMHGFGWLTQMCENISFDGIRFQPAEGHCVSSFADCIHVCGCKGKVSIRDCYFSKSHDDGVNIHGTFLRVSEKTDDHTLVLKFVHRQQGGYRAFFPGNTVRFYYRNNLQPCGEDYIVTEVEDDIENKICRVAFDKPLPQDIDSKFLGQHNVVAENISYCPDVEISGCTFADIPTRGILCTTSGKVDIHHNTFEHVQMANIYIGNDANEWYESGPVRDMEIHHNVFDIPEKHHKNRSQNGAVFIDPITLGGKISQPVHKNIRIYDNRIHTTDGYALKAVGCSDISIDDTENSVIIK